MQTSFYYLRNDCMVFLIGTLNFKTMRFSASLLPAAMQNHVCHKDTLPICFGNASTNRNLWDLWNSGLLRKQFTSGSFPTRYEFQTNSADIKFGVERLVDAKKRTAVMKLEKYNSHMVPENGEIVLSEPGTCEYRHPLLMYIFLFLIPIINHYHQYHHLHLHLFHQHYEQYNIRMAPKNRKVILQESAEFLCFVISLSSPSSYHCHRHHHRRHCHHPNHHHYHHLYHHHHHHHHIIIISSSSSTSSSSISSSSYHHHHYHYHHLIIITIMVAIIATS